MTKDEIIRAVRAERRATIALLSGLEAARFDTPTALPRWRVREVVAHLITTDRAAVTGSILPVLLRGMDHVERWNDRQVGRWADRPVPVLLIGLERWGRRFVRLARIVPAPGYRLTLPTPWGRREAGAAIWVRAYDEWIHRQDVRRALGLGDEVVDLVPAVEFLLSAIATVTLPGLEGSAGRVAITLDGAPVAEWTYDLAARTGGPSEGTAPDSRIVADAPAFVMAAAGRDSFEDLRDDGILRIEGEEGPALALLARLRIV